MPVLNPLHALLTTSAGKGTIFRLEKGDHPCTESDGLQRGRSHADITADHRDVLAIFNFQFPIFAPVILHGCHNLIQLDGLDFVMALAVRSGNKPWHVGQTLRTLHGLSDFVISGKGRRPPQLL